MRKSQQDIKPNKFQHKTVMLTSSTLITNVYNYLYSRKQCSSLVSVWRSLGDAYLKCHIVKNQEVTQQAAWWRAPLEEGVSGITDSKGLLTEDFNQLSLK